MSTWHDFSEIVRPYVPTGGHQTPHTTVYVSVPGMGTTDGNTSPRGDRGTASFHNIDRILTIRKCFFREKKPTES